MSIQFTPDHFVPLQIRPELVDEKTPLLELVVMVKNGGAEFQSCFTQNLQYVDEWSVLDTGSTDGTWEWLVDLQKHEKHHTSEKKHIYQEPFVAFHVSRNRLLDLAQNHSCTFQIMLDDSYLIQNGETLRQFLRLARTAPLNPQICESFTLYIEDSPENDFDLDKNHIRYLSNRILYTLYKIRYDDRYGVHEVIRKNHSISLPFEYGSILDLRSTKMQNRTKQRKQQDLQQLLKDHQNYPTDLRIMYYIAETYLNMEDYKNAEYWYGRRANDPATDEDYDEERYDAKYKLAVMHHYHLGSPVELISGLYLGAHTFLPHRPEALFMLGYFYAQPEHNVPDLAYTFLRRSFQIGPAKGGMNLKLYQHEILLPDLLAPLSLQFQDYELGLQVTQNQTGHKLRTIHNICAHMLRLQKKEVDRPDKVEMTTLKFDSLLPLNIKWVAFVTSSGWAPYNGMTLRTKGLGGSETCIIRFAEEIALTSSEKYQSVIFCPCDKPGQCINGVYYFDISSYIPFLKSQKCQIHRVFIQRSTDFIFPTVSQDVKCYLHLHDTIPKNEIIVGYNQPAFCGVICLSEWHKKLFQQEFGHLNIPVFVQSYGIDVEEIRYELLQDSLCGSDPLGRVIREPDIDLYKTYARKKQIHSFIYPSFPNRGLKVLLDMWPRILEIWPDAQLHLFCDFQNSWLQSWAEDMKIIQEKIEKFSKSVTNHGWQNPTRLKKFWQQSQIWLYPCTFSETFCLTALEARVHQLHIITCDLAALPETLESDGLVIPGDPTTLKWQETALNHLKQLDTQNVKSNWLQLQGRSYHRQVAKFVQDFLKD